MCGRDHKEKRGRLKIETKIQDHSIKLSISEARNLVPMDPNGRSDPYCKAKLIPDPYRNTKKKTKIIQKNLNPIWNQELVLEFNETRDKDKRLLIEVWDWDMTSKNDFMGAFSFGVSELIRKDADGWYKLLSQEEAEFYHVPILEDENGEILSLAGSLEVFRLFQNLFAVMTFHISMFWEEGVSGKLCLRN